MLKKITRMKVTVSIQFDNPNTSDIHIDKFFQVIFVRKLYTKLKRSVDVFTAVVFHSSKWKNSFPHLSLGMKIDGVYRHGSNQGNTFPEPKIFNMLKGDE